MTDYKYLGLKLPEELDGCLRLQSVLQGKSRSELVRDMIQLHAENNNWTLEGFIDRYARLLYSQWDLRFRETMTFKQYLKDRRTGMKEKHNLPEKLIQTIIERCNEQHQNQSENK